MQPFSVESIILHLISLWVTQTITLNLGKNDRGVCVHACLLTLDGECAFAVKTQPTVFYKDITAPKIQLQPFYEG